MDNLQKMGSIFVILAIITGISASISIDAFITALIGLFIQYLSLIYHVYHGDYIDEM